jgi:hypothetical protein
VLILKLDKKFNLALKICNGNAIASKGDLKTSEMDDLIFLSGPITEDAIMKTLQARFNENKYFVCH